MEFQQVSEETWDKYLNNDPNTHWQDSTQMIYSKPLGGYIANLVTSTDMGTIVAYEIIPDEEIKHNIHETTNHKFLLSKEYLVLQLLLK